MSQPRLVYVYAIAAEPLVVVARGIDGAAVRWVQHGSLAAAVSDVPDEEFGEEALNTGLTDMHWLGPKAIAHQEVNQRIHEASEALIPLAFGTVFRDDARVEAMLREQADSLRERLKHVRGCSEWVLTVHRVAEPDASGVASVRELQREIDAAAPGRAHLLRKRLAEVQRDAARQVVHEAVERVLTSLQAVARDMYQEDVPREAPERPLLRASVLVSSADEAAFVRLVEQLGAGWLQVQLTGPWPAYRFGGLTEERARAAAN